MLTNFSRLIMPRSSCPPSYRRARIRSSMAVIAMANSGMIELDRYVIDVLMRDLVGHDRSPSAFVVYLAIHAAAAEGRALFSYRAMADLTGLSKRSCQNAVARLHRRGLV